MLTGADYLAAWNTRDGARIAGLFADDGRYEGQTLSMAVGPYDLVPVVEALTALFPDYAFRSIRDTSGADRLIVEWELTGTNRGAIKAGIQPTGKTLRLRGVDTIDLESGRITHVRRFYDRQAMMEQLGLQVLVEPRRQGKANYGYSLHASSGNEAVPGVIALTWIMGREEAERDHIRVHSAAIVSDFLEEPGFIGIVTGFAGERGFTCSAWSDEASLHHALDRHHARAKQAFRTSDLAPAVWTSVWQPLRINRLWVRCSACAFPNDASDGRKICDQCGEALPPRPLYW